jgi:hypothetical protein
MLAELLDTGVPTAESMRIWPRCGAPWNARSIAKMAPNRFSQLSLRTRIRRLGAW